jgi:hypothetical protein
MNINKLPLVGEVNLSACKRLNDKREIPMSVVVPEFRHNGEKQSGSELDSYQLTKNIVINGNHQEVCVEDSLHNLVHREARENKLQIIFV